MDPCEKEPTDALDNVVPQDREEITVNAQVTHCSLRIRNRKQEEAASSSPLVSACYFFFMTNFVLLQQALRLLAFRQIHKILGMEPLPTSKASARNRKRRLDGSNVGEGEGEGKKDKKEEADSA